MPPTLPLRIKLSYGVGDLGLALTGAMLGLLFAKFLTDTVGLPPSLVAVAILVGRTWDLVNDPIQGYISDHLQTRWGRRRPFLLFGAIPFGLTFLALWWIPPLTSPVWLTVYYSAMYFLFDTFATLLFIPYVALTPEITADYDDRTSLTSFRMGFSLFGSLLGIVVPLLILGGAAIPPEKGNSVFLIASVLAVASTLPFLIVFAGTRENVAHLQPEQPKLREILSEMLQNRPYLMAVVIYLATILGFEVLIGTTLYFIQYKLQMPGIAAYTTFVMFLFALAAIPLWNWVAKKLDKAKGYAVAIASLTLLLLIFASFNRHVPVYLVFICSALAGIGLSAGHNLPWAILPDTIEYGEYLSGQRHEGIYYAFMALARKIASIFTLPALLLLLNWSGYVPNQAQQAPLTVLTIAFLFGGLPAILFICGFVTALNYPLSRKRFHEIQTELEQRKNHLA
jgi:GPH family glycoside/pentoside/hexuronide:cation symporter